MHASTPALPFYEYIITLQDEVEIVWMNKVSVVTLLLLSTRWNMVLTAILPLVPTTTSEVRRAIACADMNGI